MTDEEMAHVYGIAASRAEHKRGDRVRYRVEGVTQYGEIVWVAAASTLPSSGQHFPPHYVVAPDRGGFVDMVLFSDVVMSADLTLVKCPYCTGSHYQVEFCPLNPHRKKRSK